jgi:hypothetical protein
MTRSTPKLRDMYDSLKNNGSTIEWERRITLFIINCGTIQVLKWIVVKVEHWNCLLKKSNVNVETKNMINNH